MPGLGGPGAFLTATAMGPDTRAFLDRTGATALPKPFSLRQVRGLVERVPVA